MPLGKCVLEPGGQKLPKFAPEPAGASKDGEVELPVYFTGGRILGSTFEEYLAVHRIVLSLWDTSTRKYRSGKYVSGSSQYCVVYLQDVRLYVRWRRIPSFISNEEVLVGKPFFSGKTWHIQCSVPDESALNNIRKYWDAEQRKFRNSVFLRKDGNRVWVYLKDLKVCVGWIKGLGSRIFGSNGRSDKWYELTEPYDFGLELRKKINNSYGCW
ncbi:hypothetical protein AFULGI_00006000 [Archaeoglobus fulgidus DSM 8774]|uniref:Uncharacterized protein n=2 Tax=Archaeoglobus fulgidus TaxID=2234 RepID=A0A075WBR2_ARCFL|nr:hypothetical protein AFULGI_00006000 [Archaeoglobus fulgidus DSM 8774]